MMQTNQTKTNSEKENDYWLWDSIERDTDVDTAVSQRITPNEGFRVIVDASTIIQKSYYTSISIIKTGQEWYWSEGWQKAEQEVDIALAEGAFMKFSTIDEVISYLHEQTSEE